MIWVLNAQISLSEEDLLRETAKLFGWRRMTEKVESAVRVALFLAQREGRIRLDAKGRFIPF